ncbi:hypothetical protein GQ53DRAFT_365737 [Thozetella sp. PMI_491]|nr:hypothetical protein GQ53DRAFT_365737 [Thozetella sp. PMI_491]
MHTYRYINHLFGGLPWVSAPSQSISLHLPGALPSKHASSRPPTHKHTTPLSLSPSLPSTSSRISRYPISTVSCHCPSVISCLFPRADSKPPLLPSFSSPTVRQSRRGHHLHRRRL